MNILVTGANGQLGRTLARLTEGSDDVFFRTDMMADPLGCVESLDVTSVESVLDFVRKNEIEVIVNCAAYTAVDKAEEEPDTADLVNHRAVAGLAAVAKEADVLLIHISTDYVFDGKTWLPYMDDDRTSPLSVYGRTKAAGEQAVVDSGCRFIIFRTSWLYGIEGRNFVRTIISKTAELPVMKVVCDQVGSPTFADDLAGIIAYVIEERMFDKTGIYNYSNEGVCSWYDFAMEICRLAGHLCDIHPCRSDEYPSKAVRPYYSVLDKTKVKKTFGVEIPHWADSLRICMAAMNNED